MRKLFTSALRKGSGLLALVVCAAFGSANAYADAVAMGTVEFGKVYEIPRGSSVTGTIVIPEDVPTDKNGKARLTQDGVAPGFMGLNLKRSGEQVQNIFKGYGGAYGQLNDYEVLPGDVLDIDESYIMSGGNVAFFLEGVSTQPLDVQYINIAPGSMINFAIKPLLTITFNQTISTIPSSGHMIYFKSRLTDGMAELALPYSAAGWDIYTPCRAQLANGALYPGDEIRVMLTGIRTPAGATCEGADADGNLWFTFKVGSEPLSAVSQKVPSTFLSYYAPGNPEGVISITFQNPLPDVDNRIVLKESSRVVIGYGELESESSYYYETFSPTLSEDGLTIYADFTGKLRTPQVMIPNSTSADYTTISVGIQGISDMYGNPVKAADNVSIGSFGWTLPYKELERINFVSEFTPANGESLEGAENIEVSIYPATGYTFTGFDITYQGDNNTTEKVTIAKADANESIADDVASYKFAIPEQVKGHKNVTVTLANLVCNDGLDHTTDVIAQYDAFVITYCDPENNSSLEMLKDNQVVAIETNYSEKYPEMTVVYEVIDMNPTDPNNAVIKTESYLERQSDDSYKASIYGNYKLFTGHTYQMQFTAWATPDDKNYGNDPLGSAYITLYGTTPAYVPSNITLQSIDPAEGSVLGEETPVFTLNFDGMVAIDAKQTVISGGVASDNINFASITPVDPDVQNDITYASIWKLAVPEDYYQNLTGSIFFTVVADDMEGRRVQGNKGVDDESLFEFNYEVDSQYESYTVSAIGTKPYVSVKGFTAYAPERGGINYSYIIPYNEAYVADGRRAIVARVVDILSAESELGERCNEVTLVLDTEITQAGAYCLFIPQSYFILGEESDSRNSAQVTYEFEIVGKGDDEVSIEYTPATGEVTSLPKEIVMNFVGTNGIMIGSGRPTLTINNGEPVKLNDVDVDSDIYTQCTLTLPQEYTEPGEYKVNFPAGYFMLGDNGKRSPAYEAVWTIQANEAFNVSTDPAQGKVESLSSIELTFVDYEEVGGGLGKATISINGGAAENLPDASYGIDFNQMEQPLGKTYTEDGTYVISFPAGYFMLGSDGKESPAFTLTYTIGEGAGVSGVVVAPDGLYHVYTITGVEVLTTADFAEVIALTPGLYIVNNSKVYIK